MSKCIDCIFYKVEADADEEVEFGRRVWTGYSETHFCDMGYSKKFNKDGETDCKKHTERKAKCIHCGTTKSESQLMRGFCSEECEKKQTELIQESLKRDKEQFRSLSESLTKGIIKDEYEIMETTWLLSGLKQSIEIAENWLKSVTV